MTKQEIKNKLSAARLAAASCHSSKVAIFTAQADRLRRKLKRLHPKAL